MGFGNNYEKQQEVVSDLYKNAIYFYLHFQYNGWFILALFGIGFYILEKQNIRISKSVFNIFFWLMNLGVILTFGISLLWMKTSSWSLFSFRVRCCISINIIRLFNI